MSYSSESFMVSKEMAQRITDNIKRQRKELDNLTQQIESYKKKVTEQNKDVKAE